MRREVIDGMAYRIIGNRKVRQTIPEEHEAYKRTVEIWNHPDLQTMTVEEHEALALKLRQIFLEYGVGGESEFRFLCETIRKKRRS